jgi:hypothetical protein
MDSANSRKLFWAEVGLMDFCIFLALLTMVSPDWIEEIFGYDPDQHSGSVERMIVIGLAAVAAISGVLARLEWRKLKLRS